MAPQRTLFDDLERDDVTPATRRESSFDFLNRADGVVWQHIRATLDEWYAAYPDDDEDLRRRFRKPAPDQHYAAWWELYLHRVFSSLRFTIAVHPTLVHTGKRLDFELTRGPDHLYVEALTVFSGIEASGRHEAREAEVLDAIDAIPNSDFYVLVEFVRVGASSPRKKAITQTIAAWLASIDPDHIAASSYETLPQTTIVEADWELEIRAVAVSPEHRGARDHRLVGSGGITAGSANDRERLGAALCRKSKRYGSLDAPLVLAVLSISPTVREDDIGALLFGSRALQVDAQRRAQLVRHQDGLWLRKRPASTNIAALLVGINLVPHTCARTWPRLWHHPWAARPLDSELPFPTTRVVDHEIRFDEETSTAAHTVLGLSAEWPGPERPFPRR
ncbi:MAG TPA: hypothetical protein VNS09_26270 [Solirubrobacter sp.]|nr:hypothetical protein [Solirubrobacter sp.]